jgi:transposase
LPEGILEYFELVDSSKEFDGFKISLEEKNIPPAEYKNEVIHSKGFYEEIKVQDFPIRGKKVQLCIKRRRWEIQSTSEIVTRDWTLVKSGTRMTTEFGLFLKGIFG